jgi:hypothetical protein
MSKNMLSSFYGKLCTPAKIYMVLITLSILAGLIADTPVMILFVHAIFSFFWLIFLDCLCLKGMSCLSWVLVLSPIITLVLAIYFMDVMMMTAEKMLHPDHVKTIKTILGKK